ncbi:MAG TPA: hypothetical protein VGY99_08665 [Candidatus Binataceae bacterium]|jgi:hypothetical protein|nr:hypothetical protein [Candidatus Binatus sp.]HEV3110552.1 hypothetical protein [Candidatus Binataceae bacterium]
MARERKPTDPQARAIFEIHRRYIEVMEQRLSMVEEQTRTNYVAVMTSLTEKLAVPGKPLSEIVREIMAEAGPVLFQIMQG